jgi:16S rRNA processing protein RimM
MHKYLQVGKIVNTHGVSGEVKLIPLTDDPKRFDDLEWAYIEKDGVLSRHDVQRVKHVKNHVIIKFSGIGSMDEADVYKNCYVVVDRENAIKLPEDSYFICDIVGCDVADENGNLLGRITDVIKTGSNDVYVVKSETGKELLLPALKSVVRKVSLDERRIEVSVPKGLLDDEI